MTDFEMTKLCAEAMGYDVEELSQPLEPAAVLIEGVLIYQPLNNDSRGDAQAMALVKKLGLRIDEAPEEPGGQWTVVKWHWDTNEDTATASDTDLNRAIVACVANMQKEKAK